MLFSRCSAASAARHPGVDKAQQIADPVIAEDHVHRLPVALPAVNVVELLGAARGPGSLRGSRLISWSRLRPSTPSSVAIHCTPSPAAMPSSFVGDRALARPHPHRTHPKGALVRIQGPPYLLLGVIRTPEALARQRQSGNRLAARVGVAKQRKNRVIVRRGRQLHRAARGRLAIGRQHALAESRAACS